MPDPTPLPARRAAALLLAGLGACGALACAGLPDYAAPKGEVVDPRTLGPSDVIPYRTLSRADFRGERPPEGFAPYAAQIGAATCAHILTVPETRVAIRAERSPDGGQVYRAAPEHLRFHAQMDRSCSWWNPGDVRLPPDYVLQHEQIHFALFELEARRLNASLAEIEARLHVTGESPEEAALRAQQQLDQELRRRIDSILARSRRFDEETSMGHRPEAQERWWARVQAELAEGAAGP